MNDQRSEDWVDCLVLRLYNNERFRRHFPVILETANVFYFNFQMYEKLNLYNFAFPNLHIEGYYKESYAPRLARIYNSKQMEVISQTFGRCIYHVHLFTEVALRSNLKFTELIERVSKDLPEFK